MDIVDIKFDAMLQALTNGATAAQEKQIVAWIVDHYGQEYWPWAAEQCLYSGLENAYTDLRMHCGECGI
jgi:hypothetical protein